MKHILRSLIITLLLGFGLVLSAQNNIGPGNGIQVNGSDYINFGNVTNNQSLPVTVAAWIQVPSGSNGGIVFASNMLTTSTAVHGFWFRTTSNALIAGVGNGTATSSSGRYGVVASASNLASGEWVHVTAVIQSESNMKIYLNGVQLSTTPSGNSSVIMSNAQNGQAWTGAVKASVMNYSNFKVDELQVWGRALTQAQVRASMCSKIDPSSPNLLLGMNFNEANTATTYSNLGSKTTNPTRGGTTSITSTAPIGDESTYQYSSSTFNGSTVALSLGGQSFEVSGLSSPAKGVHLYRMINEPSVPVPATGCYSTDVWGVYVADVNLSTNSSFSVTDTVGDIAKIRNNVNGAWSNSSDPATNLSRQAEFAIDLSTQVPTSLLPNDTTICNGDSILVNLATGFSYSWGDGSTSLSRYLSSGTHIVWTTGTTCAIGYDTIVIAEHPPVAFSLPNDTTMCFGEKLQVALPSTYSYSWNDGSLDANRLLGAGNYIVTATTSSGCTKTDTLLVSEYFPIITALPSDTVVCYGDSFSVNLPSLYSYVWDDNTTSASKNLGPGNHYVTASLNGCSVTDTIAITENPEIVIPLVSDTTICFGDSVEVMLPTAYNYTWSDGSIETRRYLKDGIYTVLATDGRCYQSHQIEVIELAPIRGAFTDSISCDSVHYPVSLNVVAQWSDGVVGDRYLQPGESYSVTLSNGICSLTEQVSVTMGEPMEFNLPYSDTICENQYIQVQIPSDGVSSVQWNDGSTEFERTLMTTGEYIVTAQTDCGEVVDTINVYVVDCGALDIIIPNAFTPNGDGRNDVFIIPGLEGLDFKWRVMDRWGNVVFETSTNGVGWDGTFQGADVQMETYLVEFTYKDYLGTQHKINRFVFLYR